MAEQTDALEKRVAEETGKIKVESYQKVASLGGWAGGGRTLWAISAVGAAAGALVGVVAPFFPLIAVGVTSASVGTAIGAIPTSVAAFAATGMATGFSGGMMLGRVSGTASAIAEEQERRMKEWTARQILSQNPQAELVADPPKAAAPEKSFGQRVKDNYRTYFNPKVGAAMAIIGAVGGMIMAAAFLMAGETGGAIGHVMPAIGKLTGMGMEKFTAAALEKAPGAFIAYTTGVMASFGALWTFNFPKITSEVTHAFGELTSGRALGREWGPEPDKAQQPAQAVAETRVDRAEPRLKPHVTMRKFESYQELIAHQAAEISEQLVKR